jgi:hypothetical protein
MKMAKNGVKSEKNAERRHPLMFANAVFCLHMVIHGKTAHPSLHAAVNGMMKRWRRIRLASEKKRKKRNGWHLMNGSTWGNLISSGGDAARYGVAPAYGGRDASASLSIAYLSGHVSA